MNFKKFQEDDTLLNNVINELYLIEHYLIKNEANGEQEEHLFYMIEKESHALKESLEILRDKKREDYYNKNDIQ